MINLHLNLHNSSTNYSLFNKKWKDMLTMLYIYILKKILTGYILLEKVLPQEMSQHYTVLC